MPQLRTISNFPHSLSTSCSFHTTSPTCLYPPRSNACHCFFRLPFPQYNTMEQRCCDLCLFSNPLSSPTLHRLRFLTDPRAGTKHTDASVVVVRLRVRNIFLFFISFPVCPKHFDVYVKSHQSRGFLDSAFYPKRRDRLIFSFFLFFFPIRSAFG